MGAVDFEEHPYGVLRSINWVTSMQIDRVSWVMDVLSYQLINSMRSAVAFPAHVVCHGGEAAVHGEVANPRTTDLIEDAIALDIH